MWPSVMKGIEDGRSGLCPVGTLKRLECSRMYRTRGSGPRISRPCASCLPPSTSGQSRLSFFFFINLEPRVE